MEDVEPALALFNRWSRSVIGRDEITDAQAIRNEWVSPGFDPAEDIRLVFAPNGEMAGYIEVWTTVKPPVHPWMWGRVDPDYEDLGIGTWMLHWAEQRALQALRRCTCWTALCTACGHISRGRKTKETFRRYGLSSHPQLLSHADRDGCACSGSRNFQKASPSAPTTRRPMLKPSIVRRLTPSVIISALWSNPLKKACKRFKHFRA